MFFLRIRDSGVGADLRSNSPDQTAVKTRGRSVRDCMLEVLISSARALVVVRIICAG